MDFRAARTEHSAAVPLDGGFAVGIVLRGGTGNGRESAIDAVDRRAIHTDAVLRDPEDGLVARRARTPGQCKTGTPADAADGAGGDLSEATAVGSRARAQDLSVSAAQSQDRSARPGLGQRYHLHPAAAGIRLSGGGHGLVQPLCAGVGSIDFVGERLLRGGAGLGLATTRPEIFNTDQGSQFTSEEFTNRLEQRDITISMDGRGRAMDNIFIERLWRTVKYEEVYLKDYVDVLEAVSNLKSYFTFYNHERPHQSLGYQTPAAIYFGKAKCV